MRISDWSSDVCSSDLVLGAVEIDQALVERNLVISVEALQRLRDRLVDILHGLQHALAQVAGLVAIAQFDRLLRTGGSSGRHHRATEAAIGKRDFGFVRGVVTGAEDFAGVVPGGAGPLSRSMGLVWGSPFGDGVSRSGSR